MVYERGGFFFCDFCGGGGFAASLSWEVIREIAFLGLLDMVKKYQHGQHLGLLNLTLHWNDEASIVNGTCGPGHDRIPEIDDSCEAWLEKEDFVSYFRVFNKDTIWVNEPDEIVFLMLVDLNYFFFEDL